VFSHCRGFFQLILDTVMPKHGVGFGPQTTVYRNSEPTRSSDITSRIRIVQAISSRQPNCKLTFRSAPFKAQNGGNCRRQQSMCALHSFGHSQSFPSPRTAMSTSRYIKERQQEECLPRCIFRQKCALHSASA